MQIVKTTKYLFGGLLAIVFGLYLLIWALSPFFIKQQLEPVLADFGMALTEESQARFNPFTFSLHLSELSLLGGTNQTEKAYLEKARINLDTEGLLRKAFVIEEVFLSTGRLQVDRDAESMRVAGFELAGSADQGEEDKPSSEPLEWQIEIVDFRIDSLVTTIKDQGIEHVFVTDNLKLQNVGLSLKDQIGALSLQARLNEAEVKGQVYFDLSNGTGSINTTLEIKQFKPGRFLYLSPKLFSELSGELAIELEQELELREQGFAIALESFKLMIENAAITANSINTRGTSLEFTLNNAEIEWQNDAFSKLTLNPELTIKEVSIVPAQSEDQLIRLKSIKSKEMTVGLNDSKSPVVTLASLKLNGLVFSQPANPDLPAVFSTEGIEISGVTSNQSQTLIEDIQILPFKTHLFIGPEAEMENMVSLSVEGDSTQAEDVNGKTKSTETQAEPEQGQPYGLVVNRISKEGESEIVIRDQSVSPTFQETMHFSKLLVGEINTRDPELKTPFELAFKSDKYSAGEASGQMALFSERVNLTLTSKLNEFSLPKVSPYVRQSAGFDLLAGQFDLVTEVTIVEDEIEGEAILNMRGIELESANDVKSGALSESSFFPLNVALGALKDGDGNIEMDIPLSGNVNDPSFGLDGFILLVSQKAALAAAESYAINTFVPYANIVSLAKVAGSYALKVRIDDMVYEPGQIEPSESQAVFIEGLVGLLEQKPDMQVKVCPIARPEDDNRSVSELENSEVLAALKSLADRRALALKDKMIEQYKVSSSRLLLCQARIDTEEGEKPRIEFSI